MSQSLRLQWAAHRRETLPCYIPPDVKRRLTRAFSTRYEGSEIFVVQAGSTAYIYYDEREFNRIERVYKPAGLKKRATVMIRDNVISGIARDDGKGPTSHARPIRTDRRKLTIEVYGGEAELQTVWSRIKSTLVLRGGPVVFVGHKTEGE